MKPWKPIQKPAELAEGRLLEAILAGRFPVNRPLPGERELAAQIGVTRPTLREALQRLARDGWLDIQHGKPTRVRDYWQEGSLGVLSTLARLPAPDSADFIAHLLEIRILLAPAYTRQALDAAAAEIAALLEGFARIEDVPAAFAAADWELHHRLTLRADNPIFRLLLNSFQDLYRAMGVHYFTRPQARRHSRAFYAALLGCARRGDGLRAERLTRQVMTESLELWKKPARRGGRTPQEKSR